MSFGYILTDVAGLWSASLLPSTEFFSSAVWLQAVHCISPETESVPSSDNFCVSGSLQSTAAKSHPVVEYVVKSGKPAHYPRLSFTIVCFLLIYSFILII